MRIIDPHIHLFDLSAGDYHWLKNDSAPFWPDKHIINKNFSVQDITLTAPCSLAGFVHIEAGFNNDEPWREIKWLTESISAINLKNTVPVFKAVAFIDITASEALFNEQLTQLLHYDCVIGCRYILDDNATDILQQPQVVKNLATLADNKFSFDVQMPLDDLASVNELLKVLAILPTLQVIINHAGFPTKSIKNDEETDFKKLIAWQNWQQAINLLARFENCAIKCSGWEMADRQYKSQWIQQVLEHCLTSFGQKRVMLASNFPLTLFSSNYQSYWQTINGLLEADELQNLITDLCFDNANKLYKLNIT